MSGAGFLILIVAFGFLYFVLVRPQKRRQIAARQLAENLTEGDEVMTSGGIYGTVTGLGDDEVTVRIADNVEVRMARRAIAAVLPKDEPGALENPG
ncbi:MAG TPA: preprotein translocase subunit YajC [Gaiellaceae bacterium]|jgi:preprotein translocase subunit YajC|nr:preprotein translocase subunit YajC [Gaiellaceae bacterium]